MGFWSLQTVQLHSVSPVSTQTVQFHSPANGAISFSGENRLYYNVVPAVEEGLRLQCRCKVHRRMEITFRSGTLTKIGNSDTIFIVDANFKHQHV